MYLRITTSGSMEKCTKDLIQIGFVTIAEQSKEQLVSDSFDHHITSSPLNKDKRHHHPDVSCEDILLINIIVRGPESVTGKKQKKKHVVKHKILFSPRRHHSDQHDQR